MKDIAYLPAASNHDISPLRNSTINAICCAVGMILMAVVIFYSLIPLAEATGAHSFTDSTALLIYFFVALAPTMIFSAVFIISIAEVIQIRRATVRHDASPDTVDV